MGRRSSGRWSWPTNGPGLPPPGRHGPITPGQTWRFSASEVLSIQFRRWRHLNRPVRSTILPAASANRGGGLVVLSRLPSAPSSPSIRGTPVRRSISNTASVYIDFQRRSVSGNKRPTGSVSKRTPPPPPVGLQGELEGRSDDPAKPPLDISCGALVQRRVFCRVGKSSLASDVYYHQGGTWRMHLVFLR